MIEGREKFWKEKILDLTSTKPWGLQKICDKAGTDAPTSRTVRNWLAQDPEFRTAWLEAKASQAELLADEVIEIADTPVMGIKTEKTRIGWQCPKCGRAVKWLGSGFFHENDKDDPACAKPDPVYEDKTVEADMIEHRRLQVAARQWKSGKLAPKKYGDRMQLANDEENPVGTTLAQVLTLEELTKIQRRMKEDEKKPDE